MTTMPLSRERKVIDYLVKNPDGARFAELHRAVAPDVEVPLFAGTVSSLLRRKKITRSGKVRHYVYRASAAAAVDRRKNRPKAAHTSAPPARRTVVVAPPATVPVSAGLSLVALPSVTSLRNDVEAKRPEREAIARDVAAFLASGGAIQRFAPGESSQSGVSVADQQAAYLKAFMPDGASHKRRAARAS